MLTVYSTQGSPGASTTAMHLAASWASEGREVLLIELDPAGGSMSHNLGIQFTPGSASFLASGLPALSNYLIDHAQDVLFENLHVMPAPASPTGARGIFNTFSDYAEDLRAISENEMAVIIDGGRITADAAASDLTARAAGVLVVCRHNSQLSSLEHLRSVLDAGGGGAGPKGCAVAVGKSPMEPDEWLETGLTFCGSIEIVSDMATDLSSYMARSKRKSKKWRASLEQVGETMYAYAQPPLSGASHRSHSAEPTATADTGAAEGTAAAAPVTAPTQDPAAYGPPPMSTPEAGYGQSHYLPPTPESQPGYGQSHYLPPTVGPGGYGQAPPPVPPEDYPGYGQPVPPPQYPPPPYEQAYPPPQYPQPHEQAYPPPPYEQAPPPHEQAYPPPQYPQPHEQAYPPPPYEQAPPPHEQAYPPPQYPPPYEQPQYPAAPYEQPPPAHEQAQHPTDPYEQAPPAYEQPPPVPGEQPDTAAPVEAVEPGVPPTPNIQPTGSFRDWAIKLHGSNAEDMTAGRGG